jgi:hypothetical protein
MLPAAALGLALCACHGEPPGASEGHGIGSLNNRTNVNWAIFGSANLKQTDIACAGRIKLEQGSATVKDSCFTGDTNVVLCTDMSAPNPVMCAPAKDVLTIAGTGADTIGYARVQ